MGTLKNVCWGLFLWGLFCFALPTDALYRLFMILGAFCLPAMFIAAVAIIRIDGPIYWHRIKMKFSRWNMWR